MKLIRGIWLPDSDAHFERMMRKAGRQFHGDRLVGVYQKEKLNAAVKRTKKRRVAIDIGAHVGFWSMWLAQCFRQVEAFEPVAEHADCFVRNVRDANVTLHRCAVGNRCGLVTMKPDPVNTGRARVSRVGAGDVPMVRLDDAHLEKVDFIKIDVEGFESAVIAGAIETLMSSRPVVIIEQNERPYAVGALLELGMRVAHRVGDDWIMDWKNAARAG